MGALFGSSNKADQYVEFYNRADALPLEKRLNKGNLIRIASELGSSDPNARADEYLKAFANQKRFEQELSEGKTTREFLEGNLPDLAPREDLSNVQVPLRPPIVAPLEGFEDLPAAIRTPLTLGLLEEKFLPQESGGGFGDISGVELEILAAQGNPLAQKVLEERNRRAVEVSEKRGLASALLERNLPLTGLERTDLVHPDTFAAPPLGLSLDEATQQGYVKVSPEAKKRLDDFGPAEVLSESILGLADQLITANNAGDALIQGSTLFATALSRQNPQAAAYRDLRGAYSGVLSRVLGGERGVLTEGDIKRIVRGFPAFNDTVQVKEFKSNLIKLLLKRSFEEQKAIIFGEPRDSKKWRQDLDDMLQIISGTPIGTTATGKTVIQLQDGSQKVLE